MFVRIKHCLVSQCNNNSRATPNKVFLSVPVNARRQKWLDTCALKHVPSIKTHVYFCEDHFDLNEDTENYASFKKHGGCLRTKQNAVPTFFACQGENAFPLDVNSSEFDTPRMNDIQLLAGNSSLNSGTTMKKKTPLRAPLGKENISPYKAQIPATPRNLETNKRLTITERTSPAKKSGVARRPLHFSPNLKGIKGTRNVHNNNQIQVISDNIHGKPNSLLKNSSSNSPLLAHNSLVSIDLKDSHAKNSITIKYLNREGSLSPKFICQDIINKSVETQTTCKSKRNVEIQCKIRSGYRSVSVQTAVKGTEYITKLQPKQNINSTVTNFDSDDDDCSSIYSSHQSSSASSFGSSDCIDDTSSSDSSDTSWKNVSEDDEIKKISLLRIRYLYKTQSLLYLGVPKDSWHVVEKLAREFVYKGKKLNSLDVVCIVLMKIRLNHSFVLIANDFGVSSSHISSLFYTYVPIIADCLNELIINPEKESIYRNLPIHFYARYSHVQFLIDCFEIETEKPTDPIKQSLSWSEYKKANTIKYLLSCTPDGIINFLSAGYGGRISDVNIIEKSGYLNILSSEMCIMADRGFKFIDKLLREKNVTLVRPPSVSAQEVLSSTQSKEAKRIASLRSHVERCIRRIREFAILTPHSCFDINTVRLMDECAIIAAGLVNLQGPLIK